MTLPPEIELKARCAEAPDLSDIVFEMQITAGSKNPYTILFPKTDVSGHTRLTAEEIKGQFTDHWEMALMDYNGSLEEAVEVVTVHLFDLAPLRQHHTDALAWPLFTHERLHWKSREERLDYLLSCRNELFTFPGIAVRLAETPLLYIPLRHVPVATNAI
jgi:hypothetical protein